MPIEIERKFLVVGDAWRTSASRSERMVQGYLAGPPAARCSVRVRIAAAAAFLQRAADEPGRIQVIDASRPADAVAADAVAHLRRWREASGA